MTDEMDAVPVSAPPPGPYVAAAVICDNVLDEKDGVLSAIRIVDRFIVGVRGPLGQVPEGLPPQNLRLTFLISLKAGDARGRHTVTLRPEKPSGQKQEMMSFPVLMEGEDRGSNLVLKMDFPVTEEGLYWFDLLIDDRIMTRIPMRVLYQPVAVGTGPDG